MTDAGEVLRKARDLLSAPERWTKGAAARDACGYRVGPRDKEAVCWCVYGSLCSVSGEDDDLTRAALLASIEAGRPLISVNDAPETTHADILNLLDRAIAADTVS